LVWVFLFLVVTGTFGKKFGIPYLLLDPEYLGRVDFLSFTIVGFGFGGFVMVWNITTYILNSYRFKFLATFDKPFAMFCVNNSLIPLAFIVLYMFIVYDFQTESELNSVGSALLIISGFIHGLIILLVATALYFELTNKNIKMFGMDIGKSRRSRKRVVLKKNLEWQDYLTGTDDIRVGFFLTTKFHVRPVRSVLHYDESMLNTVFKQHHANALIAEIATISTLIALGFLIEYELFRIPSGASLLIFLAMVTALSGVFSFWLGQWRNLWLIILVLVLNAASQYDFWGYQNKAYGLDYNGEQATYSLENLNDIASRENIEADKANTLKILENWKLKTGEVKPKMVVIAVSGGGLSSAMYSMRVLQRADSLSENKLIDHTFLMTGASGGTFATAYLRELYLKKKRGSLHSYHHERFAYNVGRDLLNPICFTIMVNDLFYPWQTFEENGNVFRKDRGYIMEKIFFENTENILGKSLNDYRKLEMQAVIPMLILTPTIVNDQRKLIIGSHSHSYLMKPYSAGSTMPGYDIDGVDFLRLFKEQDAGQLKLTSALRMNATYPYILPNATLPTHPPIEVMDAGFRDNYGMETTLRFLNVFKDWILENTSGVLILQIGGYHTREIDVTNKESILSKLVNPVSSFYANWNHIQRYYQTYSLHQTDESLSNHIDWVRFVYIPSDRHETVSLSLHLTTREKQDISRDLDTPKNMEAMDRVLSHFRDNNWAARMDKKKPAPIEQENQSLPD